MLREARYSERLKEEVRTRTRELAARNAELEIVNSRLEQASLTDPLTKLGNRRSLMKECRSCWRRWMHHSRAAARSA